MRTPQFVLNLFFLGGQRWFYRFLMANAYFVKVNGSWEMYQTYEDYSKRSFREDEKIEEILGRNFEAKVYCQNETCRSLIIYGSKPAKTELGNKVILCYECSCCKKTQYFLLGSNIENGQTVQTRTPCDMKGNVPMKDKILPTLEQYLKKQRYTYLWEVTLFFMTDTDSALQFINFLQQGTFERPMAAIALPKYAALKRSDADIIKLIASTQQDEDHVCVVVAHIDYNPANLQAVYVIDCDNGEEQKCYRTIAEQWQDCSELIFFRMKTSFVIEAIIKYNQELVS